MAQPDLEVKVNKRQLRELQQMLANIPRGLPKVVSRSINKVLKKTEVQIVRKITEDLNITKRELRKINIELFKATYRKWSALLTITGRRIPLIHFVTRKQIAAGGLKRGISYKISKRGGRKKIREAFMARLRTGQDVFVRARRGAKRVPREPIIGLKGPSVPEIFDNIREFVKTTFEPKLAGQLEQELVRQVGVLIEQEARRAG